MKVLRAKYSLLFFLFMSSIAAAEEPCIETNSPQGEPSELRVLASVYWRYALYSSACSQRYFLQMDFAADGTPQNMVIELNEEELAEFERLGDDYMMVLRKVAIFNKEEFMATRHLPNFYGWQAVQQANEVYITNLME